VNVSLNQKAKNNESKTCVPCNSALLATGGLMVGLAHACVPQIEH
jgi:hypothetical protein